MGKQKGNKQYLKPGSLATKKRTNERNAESIRYELLRERTIKQNHDKMNALGVKSMAFSLMGKEQSEGAIDQGKQTMVEDDDGDYRPSEETPNSRDESSGSFEHEVLMLQISNRLCVMQIH